MPPVSPPGILQLRPLWEENGFQAFHTQEELLSPWLAPRGDSSTFLPQRPRGSAGSGNPKTAGWKELGMSQHCLSPLLVPQFCFPSMMLEQDQDQVSPR